MKTKYFCEPQNEQTGRYSIYNAENIRLQSWNINIRFMKIEFFIIYSLSFTPYHTVRNTHFTFEACADDRLNWYTGYKFEKYMITWFLKSARCTIGQF